MAAELTKVYFDTCVYLSVLLPGQDESGAAAAALESARQGRTLGYTSALVMAEAIGVSEIRAPQGITRHEREQRIDRARDYVLSTGFRHVDITARAGTLATQFAIDFQLGGPDSLHLALAHTSGCSELHTSDGGLLAVGSKLPGLTVRKPHGDVQGEFPL